MTYLTTVLADNPLHYWRLCDGKSAILHDIGSSPVHLLANSPHVAGSYTGIESGGGSMYGFNLGGSILDGIQTTNASSIELWCWIGSSHGSLEAFLVSHQDQGTSGQLQVAILSSGKVLGRISSGAVTDTAVLSKQAWHHIVVTYSTPTVTLYVDASNRGTATSAGGTGGSFSLALGSLNNGTEPFYGFLAEVAEYNFALNSTQVSAHYAAVSSPPAPVSGDISSFSFTSGSGVFPADSLALILASVRKTYV